MPEGRSSETPEGLQMKETQAPFRLYDFLAYLFPGIATLHALYLAGGEAHSELVSFLTKYAALNYAMFVVASYAIGLFWSVVSRDVIRRTCWLIYNPRIDFLTPRKHRHSPLDSGIRAQIQRELHRMFPSVKFPAQNAYAVCRSYVSNCSSSSWNRREFVSSVRAMATNLIGPIVIYMTFFFTHGHVKMGWVAVVFILAILRKTVTHDWVEWKEIYVAFIMHRASSQRIPSEAHE